jgi:hypothetical protein
MGLGVFILGGGAWDGLLAGVFQKVKIVDHQQR